MKKLLQVILFLVTICGAHAQQSPADMTAQMNAAGALHSAAASPTFATPLATYQQYYPAFTQIHSKTMYGCFTAAYVLSRTEGAGMPTDAQFTTMDSSLQSTGFSNFQLLSFVFTTDPTRPKITIQFSSVRNSVTLKEQAVLTLVDGTTGWLIDDIASQDVQ